MRSALFVSEEWKERVMAGCERFRAALCVPLKDVEIATTFGMTHVLVAGPADAVPLVVLHGALTSAAHVMGQLGPLLRTRRIYGIDIVGQSVWSEDRRVDVRGDDYGRWLLEVLDGLELDQADIVGVSYGGYVGLRAAIVDARRIRRLMLLAPAGIVAGGVWEGLRGMGWPILLYRLFPTAGRLHRAVQGIFTQPDLAWTAYFGVALRAYQVDLRLPPVISDAELQRVRCRTLVLASELDASFPGARLLARVKRWMPDVEVELIPGAKHCPPLTEEFRTAMAGRIERFTAGLAPLAPESGS